MLKIAAYIVATLLVVRLVDGVSDFFQIGQLDDPVPTAVNQSTSTAPADLGDVRNLADLLEPIRSEKKLPALAAAMVKDGKTVALGAVGVRRAGGTERVGIDDCFHLGSCTKSMTATLCGMLVVEGKLKWGSTIGEVFADQSEKILPEYREVTLEQLLTHHSGLPEDRIPDKTLWPKIRALSGSMLEQRRQLIELALSQKPTAPPGTKFQYSNLGYTIAGAMCERVTGKTWEDLLRTRLFAPLGMTTAGFGPPGTAAAVDQPWGHLVQGGKWKPMPPGPEADNPAVIGPAGTVHCSLGDWAKYAAFHLRAGQGKDPLLPAEIFQKLHTPLAGEDYAYGWGVTKRGWAGGTTLTHAGSNTMWFAVIWLAPERGTAFLAATNVGTDEGFKGCDAAVAKMVKLADSLSSQP